jgi:predicted N-acetyltransferase YhbS
VKACESVNGGAGVRSGAMTAVRAEASGDEDAIRRLNELSFEDQTEADLIDALRGYPLVAVLGHPAYYPRTVVYPAAWSGV